MSSVVDGFIISRWYDSYMITNQIRYFDLGFLDMKITVLFILPRIKYFVTCYNCVVYVMISCCYAHWSCLNHALYFNKCIQLFYSVQHRHRCMQQYTYINTHTHINTSDDIFLLSTFYEFRAWNIFANTRRQNKIINTVCPYTTDLIYEI